MSDPKPITLTGREFTSYNAGMHTGAANAYGDCADFMERAATHLKAQSELLPAGHPVKHTLEMFTQGAVQIRAQAKKHHVRGEAEVGKLHAWSSVERAASLTKTLVVAALALGAMAIGAFMLLR